MDELDTGIAVEARKIIRIPVAVFSILTLIFQAFVINYYLVTYYNKFWLLWILADVLVIGLFTAAYIMSIAYLIRHRTFKWVKLFGTQLPLVYISWFIYAIFLVARIGIIYDNFAFQLQEENFFGPNMLKSALAATCMVFFFHVLAHSDACPNTARDTYVMFIVYKVTIDLLDSVTLLDILFVNDSRILVSFEISKSLVAISCINVILPTIPLAEMSWTKFGKSNMPKILDLVYVVCYMLAVNVPLLVLRLMMWHVYSSDVSVFVIKNAMVILFTLKKICDHAVEIYHKKQEEREKSRKEEQEMQNLNNSKDHPTTEL